MSFLAAVILLAQVGPFTPPGGGNASPLPPELQDRRPRREARTVPAEPAPAAQSADCSKAGDTVSAALCRGLAASERQDWAEAEAAFLQGREASTGPERARLGAMAGNAALAQGDAARALGLLDSAKADLGSDAGRDLIEIDRARALVALKRLPEAEAALTKARTLAPDNADAWLLSATLSRRLNNLDEAQARIETAARLQPVNPEIGLEAGVIAVLADREEAARKSWQSVIATAPHSAAADTAKGYLAQLGPVPGTKP